jgi:hypothetical protein
VTLKDEHEQEIVVARLPRGKFGWYFLHDRYPEPNGRFGSRAEAIADAQAFCDECAA